MKKLVLGVIGTALVLAGGNIISRSIDRKKGIVHVDFEVSEDDDPVELDNEK